MRGGKPWPPAKVTSSPASEIISALTANASSPAASSPELPAECSSPRRNREPPAAGALAIANEGGSPPLPASASSTRRSPHPRLLHCESKASHLECQGA